LAVKNAVVLLSGLTDSDEEGSILAP